MLIEAILCGFGPSCGPYRGMRACSWGTTLLVVNFYQYNFHIDLTFTTFSLKEGPNMFIGNMATGWDRGGSTSRALISAVGSLNILYWHRAGAYEARYSRDPQNILVTIVFSQILCHVNVDADRWGFILPSLGEIIGLQACNKSIWLQLFPPSLLGQYAKIKCLTER